MWKCFVPDKFNFNQFLIEMLLRNGADSTMFCFKTNIKYFSWFKIQWAEPNNTLV